MSSKLLQDAQPGDTEVIVEKKLKWLPGDKLAFPPSDMRYRNHDYAEVVTYDSITGVLKLDRPLSFYHYGKNFSTAKDYSGIDMRSEVYLLSKNVVIRGSNQESWGCQILTGSYQESLSSTVKRGSTVLDNVEIFNCSQ